jgi:hypothetical protein
MSERGHAVQIGQIQRPPAAFTTDFSYVAQDLFEAVAPAGGQAHERPTPGKFNRQGGPDAR